MNKDERDEEKESLVRNIVIPVILWLSLNSATNEKESLAWSKRIGEYEGILEYFVFAKTPDYSGFIDFLAKNSRHFIRGDYRVLKRMTTGEIDYVFERIREIKVESHLEKALSKTG